MKTLIILTVSAIALSLSASARAINATWDLDPSSGDWNTGLNWTLGIVPELPGDIATFAASNTTDVFLSTAASGVAIVFTPEASAFNIDVPFATTLILDGPGVTNTSTQVQHFSVGADTTTAGLGGRIIFSTRASAGRLNTYTAAGATESGRGGGAIFFNSFTTASNSTFILEGCTASGALPANLSFGNTATASRAVIMALGGTNGGPGGLVQFVAKSNGDRAQLQLLGNGSLELSFHGKPGLSIGSLDGAGTVFLGETTLTVGTNNLTTTFSGLIQDGGIGGGVKGKLVKTGTGRLTLSRGHLYTGGTRIEAGQLFVNNANGAGLGSGPVAVNGGVLGGVGIITGAVTVGTIGALSPAGDSLGQMTVENHLTFNAGSTYLCDVHSGTAEFDSVAAAGVTIDPAAQFQFGDLGASALAVGTVFKVIDNTAATPIAGAFADLPEGTIVSLNGNNFQASYTGGDGNDLTLTVVP